MAAKEVRFSDDARATHVQGREHPRQCRQGDARPQGPQCRARQELRRSHRHQGRRVRREGNRAQGQVREHGRADGEGSRFQHLRRGRRRHHHRHRARAGDHPRRPEGRLLGPQPDGREARHRQGRHRRRRRAEEALQALQGLQGDRAGRHDLRELRRVHRQDHCGRDGEGRQGRRDHRRRRLGSRERARSGRGHAVRPRLPLAVLHQQPAEPDAPSSKSR